MVYLLRPGSLGTGFGFLGSQGLLELATCVLRNTGRGTSPRLLAAERLCAKVSRKAVDLVRRGALLLVGSGTLLMTIVASSILLLRLLEHAPLAL